MTKNSWHQYSKRAPRAARTSRDGDVFDSKTELDRWEYLRLLERAGDVSNLQRQVRYELIMPDGTPIMAGDKVAVYTPDFVYFYTPPGRATKELITEDVKGYQDEASKFRIRVFEAIHRTKVMIVQRVNGTWKVS